jgi:hypothetical protein
MLPSERIVPADVGFGQEPAGNAAPVLMRS